MIRVESWIFKIGYIYSLPSSFCSSPRRWPRGDEPFLGKAVFIDPTKLCGLGGSEGGGVRNLFELIFGKTFPVLNKIRCLQMVGSAVCPSDTLTSGLLLGGLYIGSPFPQVPQGWCGPDRCHTCSELHSRTGTLNSGNLPLSEQAVSKLALGSEGRHHFIFQGCFLQHNPEMVCMKSG